MTLNEDARLLWLQSDSQKGSDHIQRALLHAHGAITSHLRQLPWLHTGFWACKRVEIHDHEEVLVLLSSSIL